MNKTDDLENMTNTIISEDNTMNIGFSFVVPCYNVESYVERCLDSLLGQDYKHCEIILVDDGSTDSTGIICDAYSKKYQHVKVIHKPNGGLSDARNEGVSVAEGDYIIFVDSDDYVSSITCKEFARAILNEKYKPEIIAANVIVEKIGEPNIIKDRAVHDGVVLRGEEFLREELRRGRWYVAACSYIYKRSFLQKNLKFKKGILHEDEEFVPRALLKAEKVFVKNIPFYHYVIRENSITTKKDNTQNAKDIFSIARDLDKVYSEINDKELRFLLMNHSADICYQAFYKAQLNQREKRQIVDKKLLDRISKNIKNRIRYITLCINFDLLYYIENKVKNNEK